MTLTTRRAMIGAAAALAAAPAAAFAAETPAASGALRGLWDEVTNLSVRLGAHAREIAAADRGAGLPGWMYVSGEANALGEARYGALVQILKAQPKTAEDVAIIARAATHGDIQNGPKTFAAQQLASAALSLHAA